MNETYLFTSESVSEGHPDKIADQISDAILDAILTQDAYAKVACEVVVKTGMVLVCGEITTTASVDIDQIARNTIRDIGYASSEMGFDADTCAVISAVGKQSPDIAQGVNTLNEEDQGAGDQGMVFGYATNETASLMPAPIFYAHQLMLKHADLRKRGVIPWLRPDAKSQVTLRYKDNVPIGIDTIVFSTQHAPDISQSNLVEAVIEEIIKPVIPTQWIDSDTRYLVNPTGRFVIGGPVGDCGLTGRKIIVDTYGGAARHGGGCFSGKDPSKIDRSATYAGRYVAKNIVAAGLASHCEVQFAYAIGVADPVSVHVNTFGTGVMSDQDIVALIRDHFDLRPYGIIHMLDLLKPIYKATASYGHFGRQDVNFKWEETDMAETLAGKIDPSKVLAA